MSDTTRRIDATAAAMSASRPPTAKPLKQSDGALALLERKGGVGRSGVALCGGNSAGELAHEHLHGLGLELELALCKQKRLCTVRLVLVPERLHIAHVQPNPARRGNIADGTSDTQP
jgi:hypothetical protein